MTVATRIMRHIRPAGAEIGGYDRVHDGLVSGWLNCPACDDLAAGTILELDGRRVAVASSVTPRHDVPQGSGFLFRFSPTRRATAHVRVRCASHDRYHMDLRAEPQQWARRTLGTLETSTWPLVTGWLALLDESAGPSIELRIDGYLPIPVRATLTRRDVETFLGAVGVGGFQIDLGMVLRDGFGRALGVAVPNDTSVTLTHGDHVLDTRHISDSPLGSDGSGCLARRGSEVTEPSQIWRLSNRFLNAEVDVDGDWRELMARVGVVDHSAVAEQSAQYLLCQGGSQQQVAAWLTIRATQQLAAYPVSPLPTSLADVVAPHTQGVPQPARAWAHGVLGLSPGAHDGAPLRPAARKATTPGVAVAGLIHHRSGLGQNARNSLRALKVAGIHGCRAPFFPARGGWNPQLAATSEGTSALDEHAVLLHVPIDRMIPSLSAQPTLLRTDRLIGYFMWETEVIPRHFRRALDVVDEIWTATAFVAEALRGFTGTPVHVTGHVVDTSNARQIDRAALGIADDAFVVHYAFDANSTVARKNPNGAIDAFQLAFEGDPSALFLLKVRNMQQVDALASSGDSHARGLLRRLDEHPWIRLVAGEQDHGFALGLTQLADCYLSLHRSEGYGYGIAEAMSLGTPVIATDYSGSTDLARETTAHLVPYEYIDVLPGEYFYWEPGMRWAAPDNHAAADALRLVREGKLPDTTAARLHMQRVATLTAVGARYRAGLRRSESEVPG